MEPEPSITALLEAINALTNQVGSLQAQIKSQGEQITQLAAICKETNDLVGDKDQGGAQTKPGPSTGPVTPPTHPGGEAHTPGFDSEEDEEPRHPKKEPQGTPRRHLGSLTPFDAGSSVKRPKMDLPDPYKGDTRGRKATQWLDRMMLWVALHRDQFDEEEQMEAFADPDAKRAAARKIAALSQTSTTSKYVTEFRNLMAELDWNKEAYIAHIPDELEAIFAASIKIDNIRRENEENRPKKTPAKSRPPWLLPPPLPLGSAYPRTPTTSSRRKETAAAPQDYVSNAVKKGMGSSSAPMVGRQPQGNCQGGPG
ncbi:hypothetical protein RHS01_10523 [Rhizoctonia solani]|uniref:Retrotransposon gag domain-containing protein n=1 Tax=Rhizoctonia solani TaxID=456999 RepID=A0A8H7I6V0_9AGAM|nr:hypothetical protein RHS01_10523 [Rhizoctonia solani]